MAQQPNSPLLRYLHKLFENKEIAALTDRQLLQRFAAGRSEAAFTVLVRRHGGMVLGVCNRLLGDPIDAEDAFQATFLVLARKSSSFGWRDSIGNWLYGVAQRVAGKMKSQRRRVQVMRAPLGPTSFDYRVPRDPSAEAIRRELTEKLDAALRRLPSKYRAPLVLCYLEGRTHQEAARELGLPPGSISRRVARGLELLRERLAHSGLCLSHQALVGLLVNGTWRSIVERTLAEATARAGMLFKLGAWTAVGTASTRIITLAQGVLRTMILTNLKVIMLGVAAVGLLGAGGALQGRRPGGDTGPSVEQERIVQQVSDATTVALDRPMDSTPQPPSDSAERERRFKAMRAKLNKPVVLERGLESMTFRDAKAYVEDHFDITILANYGAFPEDSSPLEANVHLEKMSGVSMQTMLDMFMDQIGGTYVIHTDYIEITSPEFVRTESWVTGDRTLVPRVHADLNDIPLDQAVRELAIQSGFTIVLDRHALGDSIMPRVTALFDGVCLDTAVEMLANMGGLKAVALDRGFYLTKEENADKLRAQQEQRRTAREKLEEKRKKEAEEKEKKKAAEKKVD